MMTSIVHLSSNRSYAEITWAIVAKLDSCMRHAYHFVMRTNSIQSIKKLQYRIPYVRNKSRRTSKFSKRNTKKVFYIVPVLYTCLGVFCRYLYCMYRSSVFSVIQISHSSTLVSAVILGGVLPLMVSIPILQYFFLSHPCVVDVVNIPCGVVPHVMTLVMP